MTISEGKKNLRSKIRALLREKYSDKKLLKKESARLAANLVSAPFFYDADILLTFIPAGIEADLTPLIEKAFKKNMEVCVPRVVSGTAEMDFYFLKKDASLESQLETGAFGIMEPVSSLKKLELNNSLKDKKIVMTVPGLAFTRDGKRLGKGMGFYDRYIPRLKKTLCSLVTAGTGFSEQFVEDIPCEQTDFILDCTVSPEKLYFFESEE